MENVENRNALQFALNRHDGILEAVSVIRKNDHNKDVLVIYAVPETLTLSSATCSTLNDFFSEFQPAGDSLDKTRDPTPDTSKVSLHAPVQVVLVNAIPRNQDGSVDEASLIALPVMDTGLMDNWSKAIQAIEDVEKVAVFNVLTHRKNNYLHRSDVIQGIDWSPEQTDISAGNEGSVDVQNNGAPITKDYSVLAEVHAPALASESLLSDRLDEQYSLSLASTLHRAAKNSPDKGIQYVDKVGNRYFQTYPQLLKAAQAVLFGLRGHGLKAGDKVLLQCADDQDFLAVFWACILGAMIPVPLSIAPSFTKENAVVQKLLNVWQVFEQPVIVCSDSLVDAFSLLYQESVLCEKHVLCMQQLSTSESVEDENQEIMNLDSLFSPDDLALLLLTSGSTGTPKAVMHTSRTLINRSAATSEFNRFNRDDVSLNWMPLDHVGGIVMFHLRDVYNACSQVQVATSWILEQPLRWLDIIESESVSITWAPNFAFSLIVEQAAEISQRSWDLSRMRFVLNGGEAVVARTACRFLQLLKKDKLPADSMHPAWGMSETASGVCYSHSFSSETIPDSDGSVEVGGPIPNTSLRIVDADNRVLCEGEKGNLQIRGASITLGYYLNPEANQQAFTNDGWFDTGDAGVLNNGRLTITARVKDEIIINGINYPAAEIEAITESVPGVDVSYTAACAVRQADSDTDALAIFFCPADGSVESLATLLKMIQETVSSSAGIKPEFIIPLSQSQIPKTNIGKIQRTLLRQIFEQGDFDEDLKQSEKMLGTNVIPDWFYTKSWYPKTLFPTNPAEIHAPDSDNQYLVFCDNVGFGAAFCEKLNKLGHQVVIVSVAAEYACLAENTYTINPSADLNYARLMQALQQVDFYPDVVLHCWTYTEVADVTQSDVLHQAQKIGVYSILNIIKSLVHINTLEKQTAFYVVSTDVQQCMNKEKEFNPHATIMGLLKTAPYELSWLSTHHIDFSLYQSEIEQAFQLSALFDEIICQTHDDEIVYRQGQRYGWHLLPETFSSDTLSSCPLKQGGVVLITGGLGGIGSYLARFLITQFNARLILVGRSVIPDRAQWSDILRQGGNLCERITRYIEIEALGGEFIYSAADVADVDELQKIVSTAEQQWNDELSGVFHLAVGGDIGTRWQDDSEHTMVNETIASYQQLFATKVYASWGLANLVSQRANTFMVSFGSVIGVFGAARYASYAAAHTFLSQLTQYFNQKMPGRFYQFDWAVWENIGLSQQEPAYAMDYYRSIGYSLISPHMGMDCLLAGLCHRQAELIIGLDADKWPIRKHLAFESHPLQKLAACYTASNQNTDIGSLTGANHVYDMFHVLSQCELLRLEQLPETAEGKFDIPALQSMFDSNVAEDENKPVTEMEKQIAAYWCNVLKVDEPGLHSSFFQLGGNSLTATQLISRLKQAFNIHLEMRDLFDAATVSDMAALVASRQVQPEQEAGGVLIDAENNAIDSQSADELLANIDQLSEEEVAELLTTMQQESEA